MLRDFDSWNSNLGEVSPLEELSGCAIAIEAADYISTRILNHPQWKEPLLPALGGLPFGMKRHVESDIERFKTYKIQPIFIFSGLDFGKKEDVFRQSQEAAVTNANAWDLYNHHEAEKAVAMFGESSSVKAEDLFRALQSVLTQLKIPFQVAPYSAWAQLAYLEKYCRGYVQAVAGSSELLLFDCDKFITSWDFDNGEIKWIKRDRCVADLKRFAGNGDISEDMFVDACMLSGTCFLPTLPQLDSGAPRAKQIKPHSAIEMMMNLGRSGIAVCLHYQDEPRFQRLNYLDKYRKTRLAVKHHPVLTKEGKVEPLDSIHVPNDVHEFIGQRLPDEIYYYLSKGLIGPRVLNWRTSGEIIELTPLDGGDSEDYRKLVSVKLTPLRTSAISLLSYSLHRFYQHKDMALRCWFLDGQNNHYTDNISMKDLEDPRPLVEKWNVKADAFKEEISKHQGCGILGAAISSLKDATFAGKTITAKNLKQLLTTKDEILYNSIWRFLLLREYVDSNHKLTRWGEVLATTISALNGKSDLEEAAIIAVELTRLDLLNARNMFNYGGAPMRGTDIDRRNNLLVSRVACLGNLNHKPIGFTGPLSRHLLAYHSMVSAVRSTLRDLAEVSLTTLLLNGDAKRDLPDLYTLGIDLPFLLPNTCALGIAVKSYLDELLVQPDPTSAEAKAAVKETAASRYFPQCQDLVGDLESAFKLWDAVYIGVKSAGDLIKEKQLWHEVNEWLAVRR